ncbi:MAG: hypothetical protein AAFP80_10340 [Pseudomonadota bacterium]
MEPPGHQKRSVGQWASIAISIMVATVLLATGGQKLLGTEQMIMVFDQIGIGAWFRIVSGLFEIAAALLLLGQKHRLIGALMATAVGIGTIATYGAIGNNTLTAKLLFALSAALVIANWSNINQVLGDRTKV